MKVIIVGSIEPRDVEAMNGAPAVLLVGTIEEVRAAGALLYQDVSIEAKAKPFKRPPPDPPRPLTPPREGE